jgi:Tfp pilus assembly protein PilX
MKNPIQNQKGIALIATLMLLVLGFAVVAILLRLSTQETKLARLEQGYTTALDAAKGATDLFIFMVQNGSAQRSPPVSPFGATFNQANCLKVKLGTAQYRSDGTSAWAGVGGCPAVTGTDPTVNPDVTIPLSNYTVKVKVIDTSTTEKATPQTSPCWNGCYYYTVAARATSPDLSRSEEHTSELQSHGT